MPGGNSSNNETLALKESLPPSQEQSAAPMSEYEAIMYGAAAGGGGTLAVVGLGALLLRYSFSRGGNRGRVSHDLEMPAHAVAGAATFSK